MRRRLDAVLPLVRADYERAEILLASLDRFLDIPGTLWVVAPSGDAAWIRQRLEDRRDTEVLDEAELIPELRTATISGWSTQQLVKLAIADRVTGDFYLTLDADVICVARTVYEDLVSGGRAVSNRRREEPFLPEWYDWAERVLGLPRSEYVHGVTPAVLSRHAVVLLQRFLAAKESRFRPLSRLPWRRQRWRSYLLANLPWTEYVLYFSFLEARGLYSRYHFQGEWGRDTIYGNSIWLPEQTLREWDVREAFDGSAPYRFVVIQSNHPTISTADVWEAVRPFLSGPRQ